MRPPPLRAISVRALIDWMRVGAMLAAASLAAAAAAQTGGAAGTASARVCAAASAAVAESLDSARCLMAAGRPAEALLQLQRLVAADPGDAQARDLLQAALAGLRAEPGAYAVPSVAGLDPRPWWRKSLLAVQAGAWLAFEAGHDSNINSATDLDVVTVPLLNYRSLALDPLLFRHASPFVGVNGGLVFRKPLSSTLSLAARGLASMRYNSAQYSYLPHSYDLAVAFEQRLGAMLLEASAGKLQKRVAGHRIVDRETLALRLASPAGTRLQAAATAILAGNTYPLFDAVRTRDDSVGVELADHGLGLVLTLRAGREAATGPIKDLDRRYTGYSLGWRQRFTWGGWSTLHFGETRSNYATFSPLFLAQRSDTAREVVVVYAHPLGQGWTLSPKAASERNASTLPLTTFRRNQWLLELKKEY